MVDRLAVSLESNTTALQSQIQKFQLVACECLIAKGYNTTENGNRILYLLSNGDYNLHNIDYCKLVLWNFSKSQRKQVSFLNNAKKHWEHSSLLSFLDGASADSVGDLSSFMQKNDTIWYQVFDDPTKPLIIDIGCGMGVSILGLSSTHEKTYNITWSNCNYIGVDLSQSSLE